MEKTIHQSARDLMDRLRSLSSSLREESEESEQLLASEALQELRLLSKRNPESRPQLIELGAIPLLRRFIHMKSQDEIHLQIRENAAAALLNLSISCRESVMSTPGILDSIAVELRPSAACPAIAQHAAATLYSLLSFERYRPIIGAKKNLLCSLVHLIRAPNSPTRTIKDSLKALFGISLYPLNRPGVIEAGAVPALFSLIVKDGRVGVVEDSTAVISQVAGCSESVDAFRRVSGVEVLVDVVDSRNGASERARENAVAALLNLAQSGGEKAVGDMREISNAEEVVAELAKSGCSDRARSKATALLGVLACYRSRNDSDSQLLDEMPAPQQTTLAS